MKLFFRKLSAIFCTLCLIASLFPAGAYADELSMKIVFPELDKEDIEFSFLEEPGENKIALAENGDSGFIISVPETTTRAFDRAVDVLKDTVFKISGANIEVTKDSVLPGSNVIYIDSRSDADISEVIYDGFVIIIADNGIHIKGKDLKASSNGIYHFIEKYLGAKFISYNDTYITEHKNIYLEKSSSVYNPAMEWRDVYSYEAGKNYWSAKLKLNSIDAELSDSDILESFSDDDLENLSPYDKEKKIIESRQYDGWQTWCHSLYTYLSPDEYFESHPEYFSMKDGERVHTYEGRDAHLCLSNPEVYEIVENKMAEMMEENPDKLYWDFSCNDNYAVAGCECEECRRLDSEAGGTGMGTLLPFINKLAQRFPDKYISTLAYLHTLKAPANGIKAEKNVVIKLCAMPGDQATSYLNPGNANAQTFNEQVKEWSKITDKIIVWDYVVNFANLLIPFPNFAVQQENQKFYEENNVSGVFHQASREKGGELSELRTYILSELMWEGSSLDVARAVSEFCLAYYGDAASAVIEYLNLLAANSALYKNGMGMYEDPLPNYKGYLNADCINNYSFLIDLAKSSVPEDSVYFSRIEQLEINILYAKMLYPVLSDDARTENAEKLKELCGKYDITMAREWESVDDVLKNLPSTIKSYNKQLRRPDNIAAGVIAGITVFTAAVVIVIKVIKKKKAEKTVKSE